MVLDYPVVDESKPAVLTQVRVGVLVAGRSVSGPARVPYSQVAAGRTSVQLLAQHGQLAAAPHLREAVLTGRRDGYARRVVTAVLQPLQPLHYHLRRLALAYISEYSAHLVLPLQSAAQVHQGGARARLHSDRLMSVLANLIMCLFLVQHPLTSTLLRV